MKIKDMRTKNLIQALNGGSDLLYMAVLHQCELDLKEPFKKNKKWSNHYNDVLLKNKLSALYYLRNHNIITKEQFYDLKFNIFTSYDICCNINKKEVKK